MKNSCRPSFNNEALKSKNSQKLEPIFKTKQDYILMQEV